MYMLILRAQHPLLTKLFTFNRDMFTGGTYTSYRYNSVGICALVYHTICDLVKLNVFILIHVPSNSFEMKHNIKVIMFLTATKQL